MKLFTALALAAGLGLAALTGASAPAEAGKRHFSLHLGHGGFGLHVGPRYGYRRHYYPRKRYYRRHYYPRAYYPRTYYARPYYGRCHYKAKQCGYRWGYHNRNYRGCMRYHGCR